MSGQQEQSEKVTKTERLLNLISLLLRARQPVPFSEIAGQVIGYNDAARLDSIEKRFDRDKAELRNMGIPVEYVDTGDPETAGYVIPKDRFFLNKIELDESDAVLLKTAARSAAFTQTSPLMRDALGSAMRKLSVDLPSFDDVPVEAAPVMQMSSGTSRASVNLQTICAAVYAKKTIAFEYAAAGSEKTGKRNVDPYGLGISRGEWYLVGYCRLRKAVRMFKLARVVGNVTMTGPSDSVNEFGIPAGFKIRDHLNREAWDFGESAPLTVKVRVPKDLASQLVHRSGIRWEALDLPAGETVTLKTEVRTVERLLDWCFSQGPDVRILEPPGVVKEARKRLAALLLKYAGEGQAS